MNSGKCKICNHEDHDAAMCKQCNCGESEICHRTAPALIINTDFGDYVKRIYSQSRTLMGERHYKCQ